MNQWKKVVLLNLKKNNMAKKCMKCGGTMKKTGGTVQSNFKAVQSKALANAAKLKKSKGK